MADSIMQKKKECYITKSTQDLHKHHIYYGNPNRRKSEQYGCWVWLRSDFHNMSDHGVHFDREFDLRLKRECQKIFEQNHSREEFMMIFGRNYL